MATRTRYKARGCLTRTHGDGGAGREEGRLNVQNSGPVNRSVRYHGIPPLEAQYRGAPNTRRAI